MPYGLLADVIVLIHAGFVVFVVFGGLLLLRWPALVWAHLPALLWGAAIELSGRVCPLTPLENQLRSLAGGAGYTGDFITHYLVPVLYPAALTRELQYLLGGALILFNAMIYLLVWRRSRSRRSPPA